MRCHLSVLAQAFGSGCIDEEDVDELQETRWYRRPCITLGADDSCPWVGVAQCKGDPCAGPVHVVCNHPVELFLFVVHGGVENRLGANPRGVLGPHDPVEERIKKDGKAHLICNC